MAAAAPSLAEMRSLPRPAPSGETCGEAGLVGTPLPPVDGDGACGIAAPVRLEFGGRGPGGAAGDGRLRDGPGAGRVAGEGPKAGFAALGEREAVAVLDAYACRPRNREAGAKLSEHAFGRAIDVASFRLADGTLVSVLDDWNGARWGPVLRRVNAAGCGLFGTALGPEANPLHADHLHFDVAERRSPYCR